MESTHSYTLPVPPQRAWDALNDAQVLRASIPGCDHLVADGEEPSIRRWMGSKRGSLVICE